jgi:hypothetical protein
VLAVLLGFLALPLLAQAPGQAATPVAPPPSPGLEPPDGEWLVDGEGQLYFPHTIRLAQLGIEGKNFLWEGENQERIRFKAWLVFDVLDRDEDSIRIKIPKVERRPPVPSAAAVARTEPPPVVAIAPPTVDRLELVRQGDGLPTRGQWRNSFDLADFDGDGLLDLVHGPSRKGGGPPVIFLSQLDGTWKRWAIEVPPLRYDYGSATAADFDGDGRMDFALGVHLSGLLVLVQHEAGKFRRWSEGLDYQTAGALAPGESPMVPWSSRAVAAADLDGDGRSHLLALGEGMQATMMQDTAIIGDRARRAPTGLMVARNRGDGTWEKGTVSPGGFGDSIALGDFDGDGRLDIAHSANQNSARELVHLRREDTWQAVELSGLRSDPIFVSVAAGDLDGNGLDDVVVGYVDPSTETLTSGTSVVLFLPEGGQKVVDIDRFEGENGVWATAVGDLDGDGHLDVVTGSGSGRIRLFLGDGRGGFEHETEELLPATEGCRVHDLEIRKLDVNGDGPGELVASLAGEAGGLPGMISVPGCAAGGGLYVWKLGKKAATEDGSKGSLPVGR